MQGQVSLYELLSLRSCSQKQPKLFKTRTAFLKNDTCANQGLKEGRVYI